MSPTPSSRQTNSTGHQQAGSCHPPPPAPAVAIEGRGNETPRQHPDAALLEKRHQGCIPSWKKESFSSWRDKVQYLIYGMLAGIPVCLFALTFPLILFPRAATQTYEPASFVYQNASVSRFDNTPWTYGSDYAIGMVMMALVFSFPNNNNNNPQQNQRFSTVGVDAAISTCRRLSQGLLLCYANSVFWGGLGHSFYVTLQLRQTWHFRLVWTVCVGCVAAAGGFMGATASFILKASMEKTKMETQPPYSTRIMMTNMVMISPWCWAGVGVTTTLATVGGYFSFQRPACDIFVAGTSQFPSTVYMLVVLTWGVPASLPWAMRLRGMLGFILMSLTLPTYPLAVQYSGLSMGIINLLLHTCLMTAWTLQGWTLRQVCVFMSQQQQNLQKMASHTPEGKTSYGTMPLVYSETSLS